MGVHTGKRALEGAVSRLQRKPTVREQDAPRGRTGRSLPHEPQAERLEIQLGKLHDQDLDPARVLKKDLATTPFDGFGHQAVQLRKPPDAVFAPKGRLDPSHQKTNPLDGTKVRGSNQELSREGERRNRRWHGHIVRETPANAEC